MRDIKVYIGTLYVGENEIEECKESIKNQTFSNITHEIFSYLPNKEAHDILYSSFMRLQSEYDYFIKLDADMVFVRDTIVEELVQIFEKNKNLDHAVFSVHDWYSDSDIMGMHMFSNRVTWSISKEALFVDPDPTRDGDKLIIWNSPSPVAMHSPNPSLEEAFMFGCHRALKVVQRGKLKKNINQAKLQFELLQKVWECSRIDNDLRRWAVLLGANETFKNMKGILKNKNLAEKDNIQIKEYLITNIMVLKKFHNKLWTKSGYRYKFLYFRYIKFYELIFFLSKKILKILKI